MSRFFLLLIVVSSGFVVISCEAMRSNHSDEYYKVTKLDSIGQYYIVYLKGGDVEYKIASGKEKISNCNTIKVGKGYPNFLLEKLIVRERYISLFPVHKLIGNQHLIPDCIKMDDNSTIICRDQGMDNIYKTYNLKGLCYIQDSNK